VPMLVLEMHVPNLLLQEVPPTHLPAHHHSMSIGIFIHKMVTKWMIIFVHYEMKDFVSLVAQNWNYNPHPCASLPRSFPWKIQESKGLKRVPPEQSKSWSVISYEVIFSFSCLQCSFLKLAMLASQLETQ
jgi:hypothetical protein